MTDSSPSVRVGVGVFVFRSHDDPRFVLGVRKGSLGAGTWSLPGGHLEYGETFAECAIREVKEETDLDIHEARFLTAVETLWPEEGKHYVTIFVTAVVKAEGSGKLAEPKLLEPDKCEGWEWRSMTEVKQMHESSSRMLFEPINNLIVQQPAMCTALNAGFAQHDASEKPTVPR